LNQQASFDDYLKMYKSHFLYECRYNPVIVYEEGLYKDVDGEMSPEAVIQSQDFHDKVMEDYASHVHEFLGDK